jgi:hypothetical protein
LEENSKTGGALVIGFSMRGFLGGEAKRGTEYFLLPEKWIMLPSKLFF